MAVAFRSETHVTGSGGNVTGTEPSGVIQGDLLVALFATDSASSGMGIPAGWTSLYGGLSISPEFRYNLCYIVRGASAPSYAFTISGGTFYRELYIVAFSGVDPNNPIDTSVDGGSTNASPNNPDPPAITAGVANTMVVAAAIGSVGSNTGGWTPPSGYTIVTNNTAGYSGIIATKTLTGAGSENPGAFSNINAGSSDAWAATITLKPYIASPIAEYSFDTMGSIGGSAAVSSTITDTSGNGNTLVVQNSAMDIVTGKYNAGVKGDGSTRAQVASTSAIKPSTAVTFMCWVKRTGSTYGFGQIFGRCNDDTSWGDAFSFYLDGNFNSTGGFAVVTHFASGFNVTDTNAQTALRLPLNTWCHIAATWSQSDHTLRVYMDGSLVASGDIGNSSDTFYYGSGGNTTRHFNVLLNEQYTEVGNQIQIDDVRVFDAQLDATAITTWMNTAAGASSTPQPLPWLWFANGSTSDPTLLNNLAARYDFSGNANDTSDSGNNGTINGTVTGTTDRHGNSNSAYTFNGSTGYISATLPTTATSNVAISAWFKTNNITNDRQTIVFNGNGGSDGYGVFVNKEGMATGQLMILYGNVNWYTTGVFVDTNWHHIVLNIMSDGHPELYLDSVKVYTGSVQSPNTPTGSLGIGNDYSGTSTPFFNGAIDDVRIYTTTLSATQVGELYAM